MSAADKNKLDGIASGANNYSLPTTTSSALGGIKVGYTTSDKNYAVTVDSSGNAYVNVPWTDNNTTYSAGSGISLSGTTFSNSGVRSVSSGNGAWKLAVDTNGTASQVEIPTTMASGATAGLVKVSYSSGILTIDIS